MPDPRDPQRQFNSDDRLIEPPSQPVQNGFDAFSPLLTNAHVWTRQIAVLGASLQREWLSFIDKRLKEDAALGQSLVACKAPDDILRSYTSFYRTAFEDYHNEFSTLTRLSASITNGAIEDANASASLRDAKMSASLGTPAASPASARRREASTVPASH
jgi:hypothetical protein